MSEKENTIYFDHEGDFEILIDNGKMTVDMNSVQRIIFTDHANMIRYTFSKARTEDMDDIYRVDKTELQSNY